MKVKDLIQRLQGVNPNLNVKVWNSDQEFTFEVNNVFVAYQDGSDHTEPIEGTLNVLADQFDNVESLTMDDARDTMKWWSKSLFLNIEST